MHPGKPRPGKTGCQEGDLCALVFLFLMLIQSPFSLSNFPWSLCMVFTASGSVFFSVCLWFYIWLRHCLYIMSSCSTEFQFFLADFGMESNRQCRVQGELLRGKTHVHLCLWTGPSLPPPTPPKILYPLRYLGWRGAMEQLWLACRLPCVLSSSLPWCRDAAQPWPLHSLAWNLYKCSWCSFLNWQKQRTEPGKHSDPGTLVHENYRRCAVLCLLMCTCSGEMLVNFSGLRGDPGLIKRINGFELKVLAVSSR